jgi:hypothetical protein
MSMPAIELLKSHDKWVAWKYVNRDGKKTKPPVNPHNGRMARNNKPEDWGSYDQAIARVKKDHLAGVGFVITDDDDLTGIDLDHVRDEKTGKLEKWAQEIISLGETYAEISPSGTGIRLFALGKIDRVVKNDKASVEIYVKGRYLTITENHLAGTPEEICPAPKTIAALIKRAGKALRGREDFELDNNLPVHIKSNTASGRGTVDPNGELNKYRALDQEALSNLDKWVPALFGKGIVKTDDGRYRIPSKVLKRKLQEDLSISPIGSASPGIIDFGIADQGDSKEGKRTPIELVEEYSKACRGMEPGAKRYELAYKTLAIRLGHKEEEIEQRANLEIELKAGEIAKAVDATQRAIVAAGRPLFVRGGTLVEPIHTKYPTIGEETTLVTVFRPVMIENLKYITNKHGIKYLQWNDKKKKLVEVDPPEKVMSVLVKLGHWVFPRVAGIINSPTLRPDGSVLSERGYDPKTQLWCAPDEDLKLPEMSARPTKKEAIAALELLKDLLTGFAFQSELDRSVALAAILTAVLRGGFDISPMVLVLAHMAGTGKSYLVDLISTIVRGRPCPVITASRNEEEMEKRIGSLLIESTPMISIDNLSFDLRSDLLCQMCTQQTVKVRVLGKSETPDCEWKGALFATGNNVNLSGDMTRRGLICNLDAGLERPELREYEFSPIDRVLKNRGAYIAAALTIARAYLLGGRVERIEKIGSYGQWSKFVREPLVWLGEEDPIKSMEQAFQNDPAKDAAERLIEQWKVVLGTENSFKISELIEKAKESDPNPVMGTGHPEFLRKYPDFYDVLMERAGDRGQVDPRRFGVWLRALKGQIYSGFKIITASESSGHGHRWQLVKN